ncbi:GntR family transcriptional regulator [Bergeriella denitrificans]|uniref:GntR family transcriptional regulator n=1 Tax=Bergeriella denitrificans TaxID=494 RepID=A0A378UIJ4_BERDE|nr:GntR family transcriptional regulator [Bergeriella denitrificans]STZ77156.1 GntR family transcriptional regulator [Bergeriella denitrificans]
MELHISQMAEKLPRYEQIRHLLQQELAKQSWPVGGTLPSEQILAETYGVSIGTIRKAVDLLVRDGLLEKVQGKGTFVKYPDFTSSLTRFFRHRNKAGQAIIPTGRVEKLAAVDGNGEINAFLGRAEHEPLIYIERTRRLDGSVIVSEKIWLPREPFAALLELKPAQFDDLLYPLYIKQCGQLILSAREQLTFLPRYTDDYLPIGDGGAAVKIRRLAYGINGEILEYRESYGKAVDFCYETVIA